MTNSNKNSRGFIVIKEGVNPWGKRSIYMVALILNVIFLTSVFLGHYGMFVSVSMLIFNAIFGLFSSFGEGKS